MRLTEFCCYINSPKKLDKNRFTHITVTPALENVRGIIARGKGDLKKAVKGLAPRLTKSFKKVEKVIAPIIKAEDVFI